MNARLPWLVCLFCCPTFLSAEEVAPEIPAVTRKVQEMIDDERINGAVVLVSHRGKLLHFQAQGLQRMQPAEPYARDSIVRIYSMSKPVTSVAVLMLAEQGKLDLEAPVSQYLPEFKNVKVYQTTEGEEIKSVPAEREPTTRDLLRHTAGLTYGFTGLSAVDVLYLRNQLLDRDTDLKTMSERLGKLPLLYQPGTEFRYSIGVDLLGRLVEVVSGETFDDYLRKHLFEPLKMPDTGFYVPAEKRNRLASVYQFSLLGSLKLQDDAKRSPYLRQPRQFSGGGGLVSTAADYHRFCLMLLNGGELDGVRILQKKTVEEMTRNQLPKAAYPISIGPVQLGGLGFGLGVAVRVERADYDPASPIGEYFWSGLASTDFFISPKDELIVIILRQFIPYTPIMSPALKPIIYDHLKTLP